MSREVRGQNPPPPPEHRDLKQPVFTAGAKTVEQDNRAPRGFFWIELLPMKAQTVDG